MALFPQLIESATGPVKGGATIFYDQNGQEAHRFGPTTSRQTASTASQRANESATEIERLAARMTESLKVAL